MMNCRIQKVNMMLTGAGLLDMSIPAIRVV